MEASRPRRDVLDLKLSRVRKEKGNSSASERIMGESSIEGICLAMEKLFRVSEFAFWKNDY